MIVYSFYAWRYGSKEFIWNSVGCGGIALQQVGFSEDNYTVPLGTRNVCDINKTHIHAYTADNRGLLASYQDRAPLVSKAAMKAIGITHGHYCYAGITCRTPSTIIPYGVACSNVFYLRDARDKTTDLTK